MGGITKPPLRYWRTGKQEGILNVQYQEDIAAKGILKTSHYHG
jgi:hypothetical protein